MDKAVYIHNLRQGQRVQIVKNGHAGMDDEAAFLPGRCGVVDYVADLSDLVLIAFDADGRQPAVRAWYHARNLANTEDTHNAKNQP